MPRPISNPPNPWKSTHVEWIDAPPPAELEVYEEHAKTVLTSNDSPDVGFKWSLNPYRGCFHSCAYCSSGDSLISMADGSRKRLDALRVGDEILGTVGPPAARRYIRTTVLDHWRVVKPSFRTVLRDGRELVTSGDHRLLTPGGWRYVLPPIDVELGFHSAWESRAPKGLALGDRLLGPGDRHPREGTFVEVDPARAVRRIEAVGVRELFDITTGTGDFIANGVVSHNCYARPTHQYWDFDAGTDFDRKIVVKVNAPERLREHFLEKKWKGELIAFSGNTDCYQPLEASYALTRRCLEVCAEFRNPVGLITKGAIVRRDVDVLQQLTRDARAFVNVSIAFADDDMARKIEPFAPRPSVRFQTLRALADAGIPCGVGVAPIIPGLNDAQIAEILTRARDAGATHAFRVMLRLPAEVKPVFLGRLHEAYPDRAKKVVHAIQDVRGGALYVSEFGARGRGTGARWDAIDTLFDLTCKRLGLNRDDGEGEYKGGPHEKEERDDTTFRRPGDQLSLFGK